jgi:hypothetical protein
VTSSIGDPSASVSSLDTESATGYSFQNPSDPSGAYGDFKSGLDDRLTASPVHDLVFPPPAAAPWESANFWWEAAKWLFPLNHIPGLAINWGASELQSLANYVSSSNTVLGTATGTILGMTAELGHMAAGIVDFPGTVIDILHKSILAGERTDSAVYGDVTGVLGNGFFGSTIGDIAGLSAGISAGFLYGTYSWGPTQFVQGLAGEDFATGQQLTGADRWSEIFGGVAGTIGFPLLLTGMASPLPSVAEEGGAVGALEDWESGPSAEDRLAARDAAWETDNASNIHGNSALSARTTYLYRLQDLNGNLLKWGITQNMAKRYSQSFMTGKLMTEVAHGSRADMLEMERGLVETQPGPLNREPWAGKRLGGQP